MISFAEILLEARKYITDEQQLAVLKKSYSIAEKAHDGQMRESGDKYITHPLEVARILLQMRQDCETVCAGLLHDVIEDTDIDSEKLITMLYETVWDEKGLSMCDNIVNLVEGVTKVKHENYNTKILKETCKDERIIIIKLADRLHNMRTLDGKKDPEKRKRIALTTFNIFVPWAKYLGVYNIKYELENLCFKQLAPKNYRRLTDLQGVVRALTQRELDYAKDDITNMFPDKQLYFVQKIKDVYGIYKSGYPPLETGKKKRITEDLLNDELVIKNIYRDYKRINELVQLKIIVKDEEDCYDIANKMLAEYKDEIRANSVRDYIESPKKNMYQSYDMIRDHLSIPIQYQIRTEEMDLVNCYGKNCLSTEVRTHGGVDFVNRLHKSIIQCTDDLEIIDNFVDLATRKIHVYDYIGNCYELDFGNTVVDLFYAMNSGNPKEITEAFVNGKSVRKNYALQDRDVVHITSKKLVNKSDNYVLALKQKKKNN